MTGKRLWQIGAAVFVGLALAMTLVQLREDPAQLHRPRQAAEPIDADPLAMQLRACGAMGEAALSSPDCRAAWAEKRRRFFGGAPLSALPERETIWPWGSPQADSTRNGSR